MKQITNEQRLWKDRIPDLAFAFAMLLAAIFMFWKCRYGFGNNDEAFYLTIPMRLLKGDGLLLHEWHLSQMAGILTVPFVWLFTTLTGGTDGIILFMRWVYTAVQCLSAIFIYIRLRKLNPLGACIAALAFALYAPFGLMALSYNSMGILLQVLAFTILLTAQKQKNLQFAIAGVLFAGAVLCCPFLVVSFVLYWAAVLILRLIQKGKREGKRLDHVWTIKGAISLTAGVFIAAALFLLFVLSRATVEEVLKSLPHILNDPQHSLSFHHKVVVYIKELLFYSACTRVLYPAIGLLWLCMLIDRNRSKRRELYFALHLPGVLCLMADYAGGLFANELMWAINLLAVPVVLLSEKKECRQIFSLLWIPGMIYSVCLHFASNQCFWAMSSASSVAAVGSILMLGIFFKELRHGSNRPVVRSLLLVGIGLVFALQLSTETAFRYERVFWEIGIADQTLPVDEGVSKGLLASEGSMDIYLAGMEQMEKLREYGTKKVLFLSKRTWYYLTDDYENCGYSAWIARVDNHALETLKSYYAINPDKLPELVYVGASYGDIAEGFCQSFGYRIADDQNGYVLLPHA